MKIKSNVLFGLIVLICSISGFSLLKRMTREIDEWRPSDLYSSSNLSRRSTYSVASSGAHASYFGAVPTVSSGSSSMFRHGVVSSYAPAVSVSNSQLPIAGTASYSQSPIAYSQRLHTTSSAEFRSFGGGGNAGGVAMSGGSVKSSGSSVATASGLNVSMPSTSMYAYNTNRSSASDFMSSMSGDIVMASTQAYAGIGNTTSGASRGISGRRNANGLDDNFTGWLDRLIGDGTPNDWYAYNIDGVYYFNYDNLYELYQQAIENGQLPDCVTWEIFLQWFKGQSDTYAFPIPSGVWLMCFLALGYGLYIAYRRKQKVVNS
jgi:hypothetical protein